MPHCERERCPGRSIASFERIFGGSMQYRRGNATAPLRIALVLALTLAWPGVAAAQAACEAETAGLKALARGVQLEIS
jgi:hypothetical protein